MKTTALDYAHANKEHTLAELIELLRIPSVSTLPEHKADIRRAADWVVDYLRRIGMNHVELLETPKYPVVYADWLDAGEGAFTLLLYGHYDVQPADPVEQWHTPPFEPTIKGDDLFARGASDDKGQFFAVLKAVEAYLKTSGRLPINVKVFIEGEEEISSPSAAYIMEQHKDRLAADAVLICDSPMMNPALPMMVYATRGICAVEIRVQGPATDLHSGTFGGALDNPFNVLVRILARMQDGETHRILIPGFYDRVREISAEERALINGGLINDDVLRMMTGVKQPAGETGYTTAERISIRPTFEIHGMPGGFIGEGEKTVLPAVANAKLTMRLVPDQDPVEIAQLVQDYVRSIAPPSVEVSFRVGGLAYPVVIDHTSHPIRAADKAYQAVFGISPLLIRGGGSLPIAYDFQKTLGLTVVMMGIGLPDDNLHAPNEKFHLPNFYNGIDTIIHYFESLSV